ncbi:MAG: peptidoglycan DD-metalloendopeptidase family protein [Coriobacteriales bacterium]|jgi:hypothetical protein
MKTPSKFAPVTLPVSSLLFALLLLVLMPTNALAAWPLHSEGEVLLDYQQTYTSSAGRSTTHHGIDCQAVAGEEVDAPVGGEVSFIGYVPDGDTSGSPTMLALSIGMEDGRTVTLMPLGSVSVSEGESISSGQAIGTVASTGDKSSAATHLHVGLKRGRVYLDPSEILGLPVQGYSSEKESSEAVLPLDYQNEHTTTSSETAGSEAANVGSSDVSQVYNPAESQYGTASGDVVRNAASEQLSESGSASSSPGDNATISSEVGGETPALGSSANQEEHRGLLEITWALISGFFSEKFKGVCSMIEEIGDGALALKDFSFMIPIASVSILALIAAGKLRSARQSHKLGKEAEAKPFGSGISESNGRKAHASGTFGSLRIPKAAKRC